MKMITRDGNTQHLLMLKERLEENGIPVVIQGENTARMIFPFFLFQPTLWIFFDDQFDDAVQLTLNPDHVVKTRIDVEAFYEAQPNEVGQRDALNAGLIHLAKHIGLIMIGMFLFIKVMEWIQT